MPTPPALTADQRREAYARSLELRRRRRDVKTHLGLTLTLREAWAFDEVAGMKVYDLLIALPRIGPPTAVKILLEAGIPEQNTVRKCGPKQRERLFGLLQALDAKRRAKSDAQDSDSQP